MPTWPRLWERPKSPQISSTLNSYLWGSATAWLLAALLWFCLLFVDLDWRYRITVNADTEGGGILVKSYCLPSPRFSWVGSRGEASEQCWDRVSTDTTNLEAMRDERLLSEDWMAAFKPIAANVVQYGDDETQIKFIRSFCPACRADYSEPK